MTLCRCLLSMFCSRSSPPRYFQPTMSLSNPPKTDSGQLLRRRSSGPSSNFRVPFQKSRFAFHRKPETSIPDPTSKNRSRTTLRLLSWGPSDNFRPSSSAAPAACPAKVSSPLPWTPHGEGLEWQLLILARQLSKRILRL